MVDTMADRQKEIRKKADLQIDKQTASQGLSTLSINYLDFKKSYDDQKLYFNRQDEIHIFFLMYHNRIWQQVTNLVQKRQSTNHKCTDLLMCPYLISDLDSISNQLRLSGMPFDPQRAL